MKLDKILELDGREENLADHLDEDLLKKIGSDCLDGFERDQGSRAPWMERNAEAIKLAQQVKEDKTFPWPGASNVKYPLVTLACIQYNARAFPALVPGGDIAKYESFQKDKEQTDRAVAIGKRVTFNLRNEMDWEEDHDRLLMVQPLLGTALKKTYFDYTEKKVCSDFVLPDRVVYDYYATSINSARRVTQIHDYPKNDLESEFRGGFFKRPENLPDPERLYSEIEQVRKDTEGRVEGVMGDAPYKVLEQHAYLDLDEDEYEEPYVVYLLSSGEILRISPLFDKIEYALDGKIKRITKKTFFTDYPFIPSPDGGNLGLGWGVLLGPTNQAVNTIMNQLIDAGTLANLQSGFISKGIRVRQGKLSFTPGEWKSVQATGDDLKKGIFPLPVRDPSPVLFQLLELLIDAGRMVGSTQDILMGENPGQNQPATTTLSVLEQGMKVYNSIHKRNWRSQREEFRKIYDLYKQYSNDPEFSQSSRYIVPAADPQISSQAQRIAKAEALKASAQMFPQFYNAYEVEKKWLEAIEVDGLEAILIPQDQVQQPVDQAFELEKWEKQDISQRDWTRIELEAKESMANVRKRLIEGERTASNIQNEADKVMIEAARAADESEYKAAQTVLQAVQERNENHREILKNQHDANAKRDT